MYLNPGGGLTIAFGYNYDPDGNRISLGLNKGTSIITSILAALSNQLGGTTGAATRTLSYDADGSTTLDDRAVTLLGYTYDASERMVEAKTGAFTTTYTNDGLGRRVSRAGYGAKGIPGRKEEFVHDMEGRLLGEYDGTSKAIEETVWLADPGSGAGQALPVAVLIPGQTPDYIAADQLGAPHQIADSSRNMVWRWNHDPFGNGAPTGSLTYNPRFSGQYFDSETGFYYNGLRDYDPTTGRYVQSDPVGLAGGMNTYGYAGDDPVGLSDSLGLSPGNIFEQQSYCFSVQCAGPTEAPVEQEQAQEQEQERAADELRGILAGISEEPTAQSLPSAQQFSDSFFDPTRLQAQVTYDPQMLEEQASADHCRPEIPASDNFDLEEAARLQSVLKRGNSILQKIYEYESEKAERKRADEALQTGQSSSATKTRAEWEPP